MYTAFVWTDANAWVPGEQAAEDPATYAGMIASYWDMRTLKTDDDQFADSSQIAVILPARMSPSTHATHAKRAVADYLTDAQFTPFRIYVVA